jgi:cell division protein ZapB
MPWLLYSFATGYIKIRQMTEIDLTSLQRKIDKLISVNTELRQQTSTMQVSEARWQAERGKLMQQNDIARRKVNEMIERLQLLERNSG